MFHRILGKIIAAFVNDFANAKGDEDVDAKLVNPFIDAFMAVMPQLGFPIPRRTKVYLQDKSTVSRGVTVAVNFTRQMRGNVVYNMTEDTAKFIASTMMMGMPVIEFDEMAQSAIAEMSNMLTASAATSFANLGLDVDISPPNLKRGSGLSVEIANPQCLAVEMDLGGHRVDIAISVEKNI